MVDKKRFIDRRMIKHTRTLLLISVLITTSIYSINKPKDKNIVAYRIEEKIKIDGLLSENLYSKPEISDFTQKDPNEGEPASEKTKVWVGYDDDFLYVGARMYDSKPEAIDKLLARRDTYKDSDWFWVAIDPFFDRRTGNYFGVTAGGTKTDGALFSDVQFDDSWDGVWESKVVIDNKGWAVEIKIPFSQLRFNESEEMKWGINFQRQIKRNGEEASYIMVPKEESGFVSWFATLEGLNGIKQKQRIELLPYIVQKLQVLQHDQNDPFYKSNQFQTSIGADFKIGIGSNLNLDGTVNPDFGQVEVDPAVVNLTDFETFFVEKRPFFIEGANIFNFGVGGANNNWGFNFGNPELYYSRRIGRSPQGEIDSDYDFIDHPNETRILGAAKLTGKVNETWSVGVLSSTTERTYASLEKDGVSFTEEIEPLTHYGVARVQNQFNNSKQALGMIFTSVNRDLQNEQLNKQLVNQAYTCGADGWTFLDDDETYVVTGSVIGSYISGSKEAMEIKQREPYRYAQRPDATYAPLDTNKTSLAGWYSRVMLNKQKGNFFINAALGAASPGFDHNDLGFQWSADKINGHIALGYKWYEPDGLFRRKTIYLAHFQSYDFEGDRLSNGIMMFTHFEFENYFNIGFDGGYFPRTISNSLTRGGPKAIRNSGYFVGIDGFTDRRKDYMILFGGEFGGDELGGKERGINIDFQWKPFSQMDFSIGPEYAYNNNMLQWVTDVKDARAVNTYGGRYVFGEMKQKTFSTNIRLNWTFTPKLSLQLFIQPLISVGNYSNFKELAEPRTLNYNFYGEDGSTIIYNEDNDEYTVDPDGSGESIFSFENPNFNYKSLRANLVFRYEVLPGSVLYFVWTNNRANSANPGELDISRDLNDLWNEETDNVFLLKFTYWIDI